MRLLPKLLFSILLLVQLGAAVCSGRPIEVLITGSRIRQNDPGLETFSKACAAQGVSIHFVVHPPGVDFTAFPLEVMKKYDVIAFNGVPVPDPSCIGSARDTQIFRDNLEKFRQLGGGVLLMPTDILFEVDEWNKTIGPTYGITTLREKLWDPDHVVCATPPDSPLKKMPFYHYNWTTAIASHPVTEGVHGLLLPIVGDWSYPGTVPIVYGPGWQVLVHAMQSTRTIPAISPIGEQPLRFNENGKGTYAASAPVVAVRDGEGKSGRMMVLPITDSYTFQNFQSPLMFDAFMENGAQGHESEGFRLLLNGFHWLAAPAIASGQLGTLVENTKERPPVDRLPVDWHAPMHYDVNSITGDPGDGKMYKGLFGARSSYGGGEGTVDEYVAAAKKQGLSYLVFMDDAARLNDAQYQRLIADCERCSDESFMAIPGYSVRDEWGNDYFMTDEKHVPNPQFMNQAGVLTNFWGLDKQSRTNSGFCLWRLGHWPVDPWLAAKFHILAPYTYEGNKMVDDGFTRYRQLEGVPHDCVGVSVSLLTSPRQLEQAVKETPLTIIQGANLAAVQGTIDENHRLSTSGVIPAYISNGPVIQRWALRHGVGSDLKPGGERFQMELDVKSDAGIQEVSLVECNTGETYRIFRPRGQHEFHCTIDESNTHQFYLIPRITDVNGRFALGSQLTTVEAGNRITTMGDRLMAVTYSDAFDPVQGKVVQTGTPLGMPWTKDKINAGDLRITVDPDGSRIWGFDGGDVAAGELHEIRKVVTADGAEPIVPNAARQSNNLGAYDVGIVDFTENSQFTKASNRHSEVIITGIPVPTKIVDIFMRETGLRATINSPTITRLYEMTVYFKKDTVFKRFDVFSLHRQYPIEPPLWFIKDSAGAVVKKLDKDEKYSRAGTLLAGDYLCPANEMGSPVGFINVGPQVLQYKASADGADVYVDGGNRPVKAGETVVVRIAMISRHRQMQDDVAWLNDYVSQYGIDGSAPAYQPAVTQGQLISTNYSLNLKAVDGGATFSSKKADMPNRVMVRLDGLPSHGLYGRYDLDTKQLRFVPWYEGFVYTSIKPAKSASRLYVGEVFHCDDPALIFSGVQDGPDKLLVEIHNPTGKPRTVTISPAPGFAPLAGLKETITVGPYESVKRIWQTPTGSLSYDSDEED